MLCQLKLIILCLLSLLCVVSKTNGICNVCQASNSVACHSETIFSICVNGLTSNSRSYISCPTNYVCTDKPFICQPKSEAVPSCSQLPAWPESTTSTIGTTTTLTPEETAEAFCREKSKAGAYPINGCCPCTQFIICYTRNGLWRGMIRGCEINSYFYEDLAACFSKPPECT